ncbi:MAG: putative Fe-S cluster assembly protein SufT [Gammaproteobacteria bacterium]|nr:putative Fe-S cluster assembly protein SufT [Gammaproteobacteria bacterium]NNF48537.1 putative Fe-S cluster assembly protein SufT [Woeseiaceae bacterium]MBT8095179.1 putative Fe-S cluster assembly protein SufT [Gammaproteobacteria bacterium]MBT8105337.1 putative Fe-S cluster assembly protein SufT [Gammaproteobacteria bacterium]NNK25351.1 putative Fe-S cluster assembly protein SufT [Woeseiaceae bacterium]
MFGHDNEPVTLTRDVRAIVVPIGEAITLDKGTEGFITQALGGSFTVYIEGNLFRISGIDADALGKEPVEPPSVPENATDADIQSVIWEQLKTCYDPEIPVDIVNLGLVYKCEVTPLGNGERSVDVEMTLTAPGCGMGDVIVQDAREKIAIVPTVSDVKVELVFDPPWNIGMMSDEARLQTGMM